MIYNEFGRPLDENQILSHNEGFPVDEQPVWNSESNEEWNSKEVQEENANEERQATQMFSSGDAPSEIG